MPDYSSVSFQRSAGSFTLRLLDQTKLPLEVVYENCTCVQHVWDAIKELKVRGAPAIGIAAAYGVLLSKGFSGSAIDSDQIAADVKHLASSRPTAVNLFWALERMQQVLDRCKTFGRDELFETMWKEADSIHREDVAMCQAIGRFGADLFEDGWGVLTHCNTGGLATSELGTALSAIITAYQQGKNIRVYADETRPLLQGARLTMWELMQYGVPATLICDNMAAQVMREGKIQAVIVGADRIAANGDAANKIGTYGVAILAKYHQIPFYVAAPSSTFDLTLATGKEIPIEERLSDEITCGFGKQTAPSGSEVYNPAFDVTPAELISGIVTERGVIRPVGSAELQKILSVRT